MKIICAFVLPLRFLLLIKILFLYKSHLFQILLDSKNLSGFSILNCPYCFVTWCAINLPHICFCVTYYPWVNRISLNNDVYYEIIENTVILYTFFCSQSADPTFSQCFKFFYNQGILIWFFNVMLLKFHFFLLVTSFIVTFNIRKVEYIYLN